MYDHVVKCQRAGLCLSEHFLIVVVIKLFIVTVQRTWLTSSRSAQPTLIGSSAPLRPEQPRYRELGVPSSEDGLSLSAFPTCGTVFLCLSAPSTPTRPSAVLSKLICSSLGLTINCFYFLILPFFDCVMHGRPDFIQYDWAL